MSELTALQQLALAAPLGSPTARAVQRRLAALAPSPAATPQEALRRQVAIPQAPVSDTAARALEVASLQAVTAEEVQAYNLTPSQTAALAQLRNEDTISGEPAAGTAGAQASYGRNAGDPGSAIFQVNPDEHRELLIGLGLA